MRIPYTHNGEQMMTDSVKLNDVVVLVAKSIPIVTSSDWVGKRQYLLREEFINRVIKMINNYCPEGELTIDSIISTPLRNWTTLEGSIDGIFSGLCRDSYSFCSYPHPELGALRMRLDPDKTPHFLFVELSNINHKRTLADAKRQEIRNLLYQQESGHLLPHTNDYQKLIKGNGDLIEGKVKK